MVGDTGLHVRMDVASRATRRHLHVDQREAIGRIGREEAVVTHAYDDSEEGMKAFLDLLAANPDEWLGIKDVREQLGMDVHVLPGVLSSFPRRWRNRYHQSGPLPYEQERKAGQSRYRMRNEVAELIRSLR